MVERNFFPFYRPPQIQELKGPPMRKRRLPYSPSGPYSGYKAFARGRVYGARAYRKKKGGQQKYALKRSPFTKVPSIVKYQLAYSTKLHHTTNPRNDNIFTGNAIHECDVTGSTGQPLYHDELEAIYARYRVVSSSIVVQILNSAAEGVCVAVVPTADATALTAQKNACEQARSRYIICGSDNSVDSTSLAHFATSRSLYPGVVTNSSLSQAGMAAGPTLTWYWHVFSESATAEAQDCYLYVTIVYNCILFQNFIAADSG